MVGKVEKRQCSGGAAKVWQLGKEPTHASNRMRSLLQITLSEFSPCVWYHAEHLESIISLPASLLSQTVMPYSPYHSPTGLSASLKSTGSFQPPESLQWLDSDEDGWGGSLEKVRKESRKQTQGCQDWFLSSQESA